MASLEDIYSILSQINQRIQRIEILLDQPKEESFLKNTHDTLPDFLSRTIFDLNLKSTWIVIALASRGIVTIGELVRTTEENLKNFHFDCENSFSGSSRILSRRERLGTAAINEIKECLSYYGLRLSMKVSFLYSEELYIQSILKYSVEVLGMTTRPTNCLRKENILLIGDLVKRTEVRLARIHNLGNKSFAEVKTILDLFRLRLGMNVSKEPVNDFKSNAHVI